MTTNQLLKKIGAALMVLAFVGPAYAAVTDISTTPLNTYSAPSSTDVKPNVFFILDDSGSMDWDFMPDWACASMSTSNSSCSNTGQNPASARAEYLFKNNAYNGMYYNPAVKYVPPIAVGTTGVTNTTTYPSQTGISVATGGDATATTSARNWKAVKNDAYGVQMAGTSDLLTNTATPPYFYTMVPGEYCTAPNLKTCVTATAPTTTYPYPATVRWCTSSALTTCRATFGTGYNWVRARSPSIATITVSGSLNTSVSSITVGGSEILSAATASDNSVNNVAQNIVDKINACTIIKASTNCQVIGYSASRSGGVVTIIAPGATTSLPVVTKTGMTVTPTAFAIVNTAILGENRRTVITPEITSYPYPGTSSKAAARTDCAANAGCTYAEEMTNYANWWTYYRTRMQMMKTSASNAFSAIDAAADIASGVSRFRLGYMSINNNTNSDYLNLAEFAGTQKYNWYTKLISANPGSGTGLLEALSQAGNLYGGQLNGTTFQGSTVTDPLQYSCQQNYTILSTDGFWNGSAGFKLDGSTAVGNQDVGLARPYYDGGAAQLQSQTSTLQQRTGHLQRKSGGNWSDVATCNPGTCRYNWGNWTNVSSCTVNYSPSTANMTISNGTDCQYKVNTATDVTTCTPVSESVPPTYTVATARTCSYRSTSGGASDTLADVASYYYNTDLRSSTATGSDVTGTCIGPTISPSTTPNNLCANNVPSNGRDVATAQHMTTFTLGLGAQGQMVYAPTDTQDYWNDTSGDFYDVLKGSTASTSAGVCSWQSSGACNWPTPVANANTTIDDLWHAAINGHGTYFSAADPSSLSSSLVKALSTISNVPRPGTAAAAASSNPNVSASDNYVFSSSYKSVEWYGELIRQQITASGALTAQNWSAMKLLDCATTVWAANKPYIVGDVYRQGGQCYTVNTGYTSGTSFAAAGVDGSNTTVVNVDETAATLVPATPLAARAIYTKGASATSLISFDWTSLLAASKDSYFIAPYITYVASPRSGLSQFCSPAGGTCLSTALQSNNTIASGGAAGEALVNFLRGDRSNEAGGATGYFRQRTHVLGDIVSSEARYVQTPLYNYRDVNYSQFKIDKSSRAGAVYVGANDGMLHAFNATTGQESWAYIPGIVLPDLYKLADKSYSTQHQYAVDNSPETGDICPNANLTTPTTCTAAQWKTILVGGLNRGGKGYYALDITNPATPVLLWEFSDANLGYSYGNPTITKLEDGRWVVLIGSGYNNADGLGHLYVLNANTGAIIRDITTSAGTATTPSGLSRISAHVLESSTDNTARAAYGGDNLGNLWRFDINGDIGATGYDAQLLVNLVDAGGDVQPITTRPVQATISGKPVIFVGTGRYLGTTDVADSSAQSFYAVKDTLASGTTPSVALQGNPRTASSNFVAQTFTNGTCPANTPTSVCIPQQVVRTSSSNSVDWNTKNGWYVDFLTGGERSSTDPALALGTILFTTITPQASTVSACGPTTGTAASFVYALNYLTGGAVDGSNGVSGISLGSGLVTRPVMILQADGTVRALIRTSSGASSGSDLGGTVVITPPVNPPSASGTRRVSWRVLNAQ